MAPCNIFLAILYCLEKKACFCLQLLYNHLAYALIFIICYSLGWRKLLPEGTAQAYWCSGIRWNWNNEHTRQITINKSKTSGNRRQDGTSSNVCNALLDLHNSWLSLILPWWHFISHFKWSTEDYWREAEKDWCNSQSIASLQDSLCGLAQLSFRSFVGWIFWRLE